MKVYQALASAVVARRNCANSGNTEWFDRHSERIEELIDSLPSGSGFDHGTKIDLERCNGERIVLLVGFHHMDEYGSYDNWTDHAVTVRPSFDGINLSISGRNRNGIKEYIHECYYWALKEEEPCTRIAVQQFAPADGVPHG